jgi:hypothetical protein
MRKKITILSQQEQALKALANDENGADLNILHVLAGAVLSGGKVDADFQLVANAIVAQSVIFGKLPPKKKGRPESNDGVHGFGVAYKYFSLRDSGVSYANAVAQVAAEFHKDERHIMRLVKENKSSIGLSLDDRERNREWWRMCAEVRKMVIDKGGDPDAGWLPLPECDAERDTVRSQITALDNLIDDVLDRTGIADKNVVTFIASD